MTDHIIIASHLYFSRFPDLFLFSFFFFFCFSKTFGPWADFFKNFLRVPPRLIFPLNASLTNLYSPPLSPFSLPVLHIVHFLFITKLGSSLLFIVAQKPFSSGSAIPRSLWLRIFRHSLFSCLITLISLFGLTLCGPLRQVSCSWMMAQRIRPCPRRWGPRYVWFFDWELFYCPSNSMADEKTTSLWNSTKAIDL